MTHLQLGMLSTDTTGQFLKLRMLLLIDVNVV